MSSFITESGQSVLEIATAVEECGALLEEYRDELTEVQRRSFDAKDNPPSDEEFQVVREKWQAFFEIADRLQHRWGILKDQMRGHMEDDDPAMTAPSRPTSSTMPPDSPKSPRVPFWRKFFRRISSCLTSQTIS
jgi:hypothetical protein